VRFTEEVPRFVIHEERGESGNGRDGRDSLLCARIRKVGEVEAE
jgi:hypothetical protein